MKSNMGLMDRNVRIGVAILLFVLYFTNIISGTVGIILLVLGAVFAATAFLKFCPLYLPFRFSTKEKTNQ